MPEFEIGFSAAWIGCIDIFPRYIPREQRAGCSSWIPRPEASSLLHTSSPGQLEGLGWGALAQVEGLDWGALSPSLHHKADRALGEQVERNNGRLDVTGVAGERN